MSEPVEPRIEKSDGAAFQAEVKAPRLQTAGIDGGCGDLTQFRRYRWATSSPRDKSKIVTRLNAKSSLRSKK